MTFKKVFRGYDPEQVDRYIAETALKEQQLRAAQKERIDELSDENYALRQQVKQYQTDEQAISKSLIASQQLAQELKFDAERFSDLVLSRAKIFYATWRAYAKTLVASLSDEEVRQFNELQRKIENVINAYEGKDVARETEEREVRQAAAAQAQPQTATPTRQTASQPAEQLRQPIAPQQHAVQGEQTQTAGDSATQLTQQANEKDRNAQPTRQPQSSENYETARQYGDRTADVTPQPESRPAPAQPTAQQTAQTADTNATNVQPQPSPQHTQHSATPVGYPSAYAEFQNAAQPDDSAPDDPLSDEEAWRQARAVVDVTPSEQTMSMGSYSNPITRVEQAAQQVIDLRELTRTDLSLEDLCAELGLIDKKSENK